MPTIEHAPAPLESAIRPAHDPDMLRLLGGENLLAEETTDPEPETVGDETPEPEPTEETPETETEETPEEETSTEETTETEGDTDTPEAIEEKTWPASAQKRVDKLTALKGEAERERDTAKAEAAAVRAELAELKAKGPAPAPVPTPGNPLANVMKAEDLAVHAQFGQEVADWAIKHLTTGGSPPVWMDVILTGRTDEEAKEQPKELNPQEVAELLVEANRKMSRDIPQRLKWLREDEKALAYVKQHYPQMLKPESEEGKLYAQYERDFPEIKRLHTWRVALLDCVRGAQLRETEEKDRTTKAASQATTPAAPKKQPPIAPVLPGAPRGAGAKPVVRKPATQAKLSASMNANELAAAM